MLVHQLLNAKATQGTVSVTASTPVSEACELMSDKGIGTVLVSDDGRAPLGILSERDIVRQLARIGAECLTHSVDTYMTRKLVTASPQSTAQDVLTRMTEGRFRHMPVVENGVVIGLISQGDVVKAQLSELEMEKEALEGMIMGH